MGFEADEVKNYGICNSSSSIMECESISLPSHHSLKHHGTGNTTRESNTTEQQCESSSTECEPNTEKMGEVGELGEVGEIGGPVPLDSFASSLLAAMPAEQEKPQRRATSPRSCATMAAAATC